MTQRKFETELIDGVMTTSFGIKPNFQDVKDAMNKALDLGDCRRRLWVFEHGFGLTPSELKEIAEFGKSIWPTPSRAAIVAHDDLSFGLSRIHEVYREQKDHETRVFRSKEEAVEWLHSLVDS